MRFFNQIIGVIICACTLLSCHKDDFIVRGTIADGNGQMLYLEHNSLRGVEVIDSMRLKSNGRFAFYAPKPQYPDLYQLRLANQRFLFPVDSADKLTIVAQSKTLVFPEIVESSQNVVELQHLRQSVSNLQAMYQNISAHGNQDFITALEQHRHYSDSLIMSNTHSIVAYYAIFQRIGEYYIYSPYEKADRVYCAAVATGFKAFMPQYERTMSLEAWVLNAIRQDRKANNLHSIQDMVDKAQEQDLNISLQDRNGVVRSLDELKGKVILLDFSAIEMEQSSAYMLQLRDLYNKYHARGLEIYQISADTDRSSWLRGTENLPWICVRDDNDFRHSSLVKYNVQQLPTMFIINRKGSVVARHSDFKTIEKDILTNLQK